MRILITGSRGMLARRLVELLSKDYELYGCDRVNLNKKDLTYSYTKLDLSNFKAVKKYLEAIRPEAIFHLAAKTQVDDCELNPKEAWKGNSLTTQNILKASKKFDPIFFYVSTDYVFSGTRKTPWKPTDPIRPESIYGKTKAEGENWVRRLSRKGIIVRTAWLYGPDGPNFIDTMLGLAKTHKVLKVVSDQKGVPTYTRDLAETLAEMLRKSALLPKIPTGTFHFTGSGETTWYGFAKEIFKEAKLKVQVKPITSFELNRLAQRPKFSLLDMVSLKSKWGISSRPWKLSLKQYLREKGCV